jgi:hypothetical protein
MWPLRVALFVFLPSYLCVMEERGACCLSYKDKKTSTWQDGENIYWNSSDCRTCKMPPLLCQALR